MPVALIAPACHHSRMITRTLIRDGTSSAAVYSDCERYRYRLHRFWSQSDPMLTFVMLNPSTASELQNDPTVERCERRARSLGFGGFVVTNIFAWRATDPRELRKAVDPNGPDNTDAIRKAVRQSGLTIAAWGTHGAYLSRGPQVAQMLAADGCKLHHLGLSKAGHPKHPLYLSYTVSPEFWHDPYPA